MSTDNDELKGAALLRHLQQQANETRGWLNNARGERDKARLALARKPGDQARAKALARHDSEIAKAEGDLLTFEGAMEAAREEVRDEAHSASLARMNGFVRAAIDAKRAQVEAFQRLDHAFNVLELALVDQTMAGRECWSAVGRAINELRNGANDMNATLALHGLAEGGVNSVLSRLNRVLQVEKSLGARMHTFVQIHGLADPQPPMVDAAQVELQRLERELKQSCTPAAHAAARGWHAGAHKAALAEATKEREQREKRDSSPKAHAMVASKLTT